MTGGKGCTETQFTQSLLEIGLVPQIQEGLINYMLFQFGVAYNATAIPYDQIYCTGPFSLKHGFTHKQKIC